MVRLAIVLSLSLGVGERVTPCGSAVCVGNTGQDIQLGGTVLETRGSYLPDGGMAALRPVVTGAVLTLQGTQSSGAVVNPDVIIGSLNTHTAAADGGHLSIVSFRNGSTELLGVNVSGVSVGSGNKGTCALDGGSPAQCDGLGVEAASTCTCFTQGTTAATTYAVSGHLSNTTVTCTAANGKTDTVGYLCF